MGTKIIQGNLDIQGTISADKVESRESKNFVYITAHDGVRQITFTKDVQILVTFPRNKCTKGNKLSKNNIYGTKYGNKIAKNYTFVKGTYSMTEFLNYIWYHNINGYWVAGHKVYGLHEGNAILNQKNGLLDRQKAHADTSDYDGYAYGFYSLFGDSIDLPRFNWEEEQLDVHTGPYMLPFMNMNDVYHSKMCKKLQNDLYERIDQSFANAKMMIKFVADYSETTTGANKKIWHGNMANTYIELIYVIYYNPDDVNFDDFEVRFRTEGVAIPRRFK